MPTFEPLEGDVVLRDQASPALDGILARADAVAARMDAFGRSVEGANAAIQRMGGGAAQLSASIDNLDRLSAAMESMDAERIRAFGASASSLAETLQIIGMYAGDTTTSMDGLQAAIDATARKAEEADLRLAALQAKLSVLKQADDAGGGGVVQQASMAPPQFTAMTQSADEAERLQEAVDQVDVGKLSADAPAVADLATSMNAVTADTQRATAAADALAGAIEDVGESGNKIPADLRAKLDALDAQLEDAKAGVAQAEADFARPAQPISEQQAQQDAMARKVSGAIVQRKVAQYDPTGGMLSRAAGNLAASISPKVLMGVGAAAGVAAAGVAAVVVGFNKMSEAMEQADRKARTFDKLNKQFGDTAAAIDEVKAKIDGVASEDQILVAFQGIDKTSVLNDVDTLAAVAEVAKENAYELGVSWQEAMQQITSAIQSGDFSALEKMGLVENGEQALQKYAASIGKLVPQLTAYEREQAMATTVTGEFAASLGAVTSPSEELTNAYAAMNSALGDANTSFADWVVSLIDPGARSAIEWWADVTRGFTEGVAGASETMSEWATDNRIFNDPKIEKDDKGDYETLLERERDALEAYEKLRQTAPTNLTEDEWLAQSEAARQAAGELEAAAQQVDEARKLLAAGDTLQDRPEFTTPILSQEIAQAEAELRQLEAEKAIMQQNASDPAALAAMGKTKEQANAEIISQDIRINEKRDEVATLQEEYGGIVKPAGAPLPADPAPAQRQQIGEVSAELERLGAVYATLTPAVEEYGAISQELAQRQAERAGAMDELTKAEQEYGVALAKAMSAEMDADQARTSAPALESKIETYRGYLDMMEAQAADLDTKIAETQRDIGGVQNPQLRASMEALDLAPLIAQRTELQEGINQGVAEIAQMEADLAAQQQDILESDAATQQAEALRETVESARAGVAALDAQIADAERKLADLEKANAGVDLSKAVGIDKDALNEQIRELQRVKAALEAALRAGPAQQATDTTPAEPLQWQTLEDLGSGAAPIDAVTQSLVELTNVAGVAFDKISGLPVAFDAAKLSGEQLRQMATSLTDSLQKVEFQSINQGLAMGAKLTPELGVQDAYAVGQDFMAERSDLFDRLQESMQIDPETMIPARPIDPGVASALSGALAGSQQEVAGALSAEADARQELERAVASGDALRQEEAAATLELAQAKRELAEAANAVTKATLDEQIATIEGNQSKIDAAAVEREAAVARYADAERGVETSVDNSAQIEALVAWKRALEDVDKAIATNNQALLSSATAAAESAQNRYLITLANEELAASMSELTAVGNLLIDPISNMPVAFNAMAIGAGQADAVIRQLAASMQQLEFQAVSSSIAMASRLVPSLGVAGAYDVGLGFGREQEALAQQFQAGNEARIGRGQAPIDQSVYEQFYMPALSANQNARVTDQMSDLSGAAGGAVDALDQVKGAIESLASGLSQDTTKGLIPLDEMLPREDEIDEKARQMADVAVKGFQSPWFEGLKDMFPEDVLAEGESAVKTAAAQMVKDHQEGVTMMFYDTEKAAEQVLEKIKGQVEQQKYLEEVYGKVREQAEAQGMSMQDVADMLGIETATGGGGGRTSAVEGTKSFEELQAELDAQMEQDGTPLTQDDGEEGAPEEAGVEEPVAEEGVAVPEDQSDANQVFLPLVGQMTPDEEAVSAAEEGTTALINAAGEAMVAQAGAGDYGGRAIDAIVAQLTAAEADVKDSGSKMAVWFGEAFKTQLETDIPAGILQILVSELVPLLAAAAAANDEGGGGGGEV